MIKARPGHCEEASPLSSTSYIPCNRPAMRMIAWPARGEGPLRMCEPCAFHSVKNRSAEDVGPYVATVEDEVPTDASPEPDYSAYVEDARVDEEEAGNILAQITKTARELRDAQDDVVSAEAQLKAAQDRVRTLSESTLPMLMDEARQTLLRTTDGFEVSRSEVIRASISQENMPRAVMWLNSNGHGSIVKHEVTAKFGKGEEQKTEEAIQALRSVGVSPTDKISVHPQTLSALVREKMSEGVDLPGDILGIYIQPIVKIKSVK